jgi:hypothetical protein
VVKRERLLLMPAVQQVLERLDVDLEPIAAEPHLFVPPGDQDAARQLTSQLVQGLAKGVAGVTGIRFRPKKRDQFVAAAKPPRKGHCEVNQKGEPLGLNEEPGQWGPIAAKQFKLSEQLEPQRALCTRRRFKADRAAGINGDTSGPAVCGHGQALLSPATNTHLTAPPQRCTYRIGQMHWPCRRAPLT